MAALAPRIRAAIAEGELGAWRWSVRSHFGEHVAEQLDDVEECEEVLEGVPLAFLQHFNLWRRSSAVRALACSRALGAVAAALLGVGAVRLYQDSVFVKRPGDSPTRLHADLHMAPFDTNDMVTCWLPLSPVAARADGGTGLRFVSGSQRDFALGFWRKRPQAANVDVDHRYGEEASVDHHGALALGDATWHHGWVLHGAPGLSESADGQPRVALALSYIADGARIKGNDVDEATDDEDRRSYEAWLADLAPGDVARHELLPLVQG